MVSLNSLCKLLKHMMTHEQNLGGVQISTLWRGIDDSSLEEVYYFLYHSLIKDTGILPSIIRIEYVEPKLLNYIKKEFDASLICINDYIPTGRPRPKNEGEVFEDMITEQERTYLFSIKSPNCKYPILIRLASERKKLEFVACSFGNEELNAFVAPLAKKFAYKSDYTNELIFGVLYPEGPRLTIRELPLDDKHVKSLNLELNYGIGFKKHHDIITSKLKDSKRGLFIFHGESGVGKTTYIKYLAHLFGGSRMFIFIPTTNLESLASPALLPVLLDYQNSVLVLEDAEKAVVSRELLTGNESLVSTLLNIGEGILGSMLNLSLIVTFNTKKEEIDKALLRKGRLLYEHEFKSLNKDDAFRLLKELGHERVVSVPMTLADIYNINADTGHKEEEVKKIGFAQ